MKNARRIPTGIFALILIAVICSGDDVHYERVQYTTATQTWLTGINNEGVAVGYYEQRLLHGFVYGSGAMNRLEGPLGAGGTRLLAITNIGEILIAQGTNYFIYKDGHSIRIGGPEFVTGMNSKRQIIGYDQQGHGFYASPALGAPDSTAPVSTSTSLSPIVCPGGIPAKPLGINDQGHITGTCGLKGFIFDGRGYRLFAYPGARVTSGIAINNADVVVGTYQGRAPRLFGMTYDGSKFTPIDIPGAFSSAALGINDSNQIVGSFRVGNADGGAESAFISSGSASPAQ